MGQASLHINGIAAQFIADGARWRVPIDSARASSSAEAVQRAQTRDSVRRAAG